MNAPAPAPTPEPDVLALLGNLLRRRAEIAQRLGDAVLAGDRAAARACVTALDRLGPALGEANRAFKQRGQGLTPAMTAELQALLSRSSAAEARIGLALGERGARALSDWLAQSDAEAEAAIADRLLSGDWKSSIDLVVLLGAGAAALGERLSARGQARIFSLDPTAPERLATEGELPPVLNAHTVDALERACWQLRFPSPDQLRVHVAGPLPRLSADDVIARLQRMLQAVSRAHGELEDWGGTFVKTSTQNLAPIARVPSLDALVGAFAGVPAVVVAAGPSLDKNLAGLKALQGRAVIIAINQTVGALRRAGVRPDIVVAIDPLNIEYHFAGTQPGEIGALCLGASVRRSLFDLPAEHVLTFASSPTSEAWIYELVGEHAGLNTGGTVATGAVQLALALGCSPIISVGRDLALDGLRYYADAAADGGQEVAVLEPGKVVSRGGITKKLQMAGPEEQAAMKRLLDKGLELIEIPGYHGRPVISTSNFVYEIDVLRTLVRNRPAGTTLINATEGGAFLEGMEHVSLAEVDARLGDRAIDTRAVLAERLGGVALEPRRQRFAEALRALGGELQRAARLAENSQGQGGARPAAQARARRELSKLAAELPVLSVLSQRVVRDVERARHAGWSSQDEVEAKAAALFTSIGAEARALAAAIDAVLPAVEAAE